MNKDKILSIPDLMDTCLLRPLLGLPHGGHCRHVWLYKTSDWKCQFFHLEDTCNAIMTDMWPDCYHIKVTLYKISLDRTLWQSIFIYSNYPTVTLYQYNHINFLKTNLTLKTLLASQVVFLFTETSWKCMLTTTGYFFTTISNVDQFPTLIS